MPKSLRLLASFFLVAALFFPLHASAADTVTVSGTVVDDETGEPIKAMMIQAGKFDKETPGKIIWGWSERRTQSQTGSFSYRVKWNDGWTARVVVDGYLPQAILTESPPDGKEKIEVELRLKRGRLLTGIVVDHDDKPVKSAVVFPVGPGGINVYEGKALDSYSGKVDARAKGVETDENGKFEVPIGGAKSIVVTSKSLDAWAVVLDDEGGGEKGKDDAEEKSKALKIKLPESAKLTINLDIEGCEKETEIFYQFLTSYMDGFKGVSSMRTVPIKNGGKLELNSLTPGKYQFWRKRQIRFDSMGIGGSLDRIMIELKPGEKREINMVRKTGARVGGVVSWPEDMELSGVAVKFQSIEPAVDPWGGHEYKTTYDIQQLKGTAELDEGGGNSRKFRTDKLAPGKYAVVVEAYKPLTEAQRFSTGIVRPMYGATAELIVPDMGEPEPIKLKLAPLR